MNFSSSYPAGISCLPDLLVEPMWRSRSNPHSDLRSCCPPGNGRRHLLTKYDILMEYRDRHIVEGIVGEAS